MLTIPATIIAPAWAHSALVFIPSVSVYYTLLRQPAVSNEVLATVGFLMMFSLPLIFQCDSPLWNVMVALCCQVFMVMRTFEISTFSRSFNSKWTLYEYFEFLCTSENESLRALEHAKALKQQKEREEKKLPPPPAKWTPFTAKPEERSIRFYLEFWTRILITLAVYLVSRAYLEKYGFESRYGFITPWDSAAVGHVMYTALIYCSLELGYMVPSLVGAILMQTPMVYMFHHPYLSTSFRDFWSYRWNYAIKETLHRLGFAPTLQILSKVNPPPKQGAKPPAAHFALASMSSFFLSAVMHEYMVFLYMPGQPFGENTAFFMLQGGLTFLQVHLMKTTGFGKTWGQGIVWLLLGWATTMLLTFMMNPLFIGPYARSGLLMNEMKPPVPDFIMDAIKSNI